jgi:adenylate kinase family enzyme
MIVSFIGVPCVGKGTLVKTLQERLLERYPAAVLTTSDIVKDLLKQYPEAAEVMKTGGLFPLESELREALYLMIEDLYAFGADVILLDGFPRFDDQVRWLRQTFYDKELRIVQVLAPSDFEIVRRAGMRQRDEYDTPEKVMLRVAKQRQLMAGVEQLISSYALPYTSVINDQVERAALEILNRIDWPPERKSKKKDD